MTDDHKHELAWAFEGPLWFCACGAEFFPGIKVAQSSDRPARRHSFRIRLGRHS